MPESAPTGEGAGCLMALNALTTKLGHARWLRSALVLRSAGKCERCRKRRARHMHHLTYERKGWERLQDVLHVCPQCHQKEHGTGRNPQREAEIIMLYRGGATMQEVGDAVKMSRQRVQQILARAGEAGVYNTQNPTDPIKIANALKVAKSTKEAAKISGYSVGAVRAVARALGLSLPSLQEMYTKAQLIDNMKHLAAKIGRTPNIFDINATGRMCHTVYVQRFGSVRAAQKAAGLRPNPRGDPGHRDRVA